MFKTRAISCNVDVTIMFEKSPSYWKWDATGRRCVYVNIVMYMMEGRETVRENDWRGKLNGKTRRV